MVAVIGDIHGCFFTLTELVKQIRNKYSNLLIYCVGDLVDRGNFSFEVLEFVKMGNINFTPGNHDYMFYFFVNEPTNSMGKAWLFNGYENTLNSYNNHFDVISEHFNLIKKAPLFYNLDDCFISHAGISKFFKRKLPSNFREDLNLLNDFVYRNLDSEHSILWTRERLLDLGKLQIVGHTRKIDVLFDKKNNVVYIDTSCYSGNKLSAVIVENDNVIDILSVSTNEKDIQKLSFPH